MTRQTYLKMNYRDVLRSLKMPSNFDKLMEKISKPKGAIPNFGLPRWQLMSLDSKIPAIPAPEGAYYFSRKKIGQNLFVQSENSDFILDDPYNNEINFLSYNSLHDKHLVDYFARKNNIKYLQQHGFVTKNLDAICSVREYNMYRKYLKKLYSECIKKELKRQFDLRADKKILKKAEIEAQKDIESAKIQEKKDAAKLKVIKDAVSRDIEKLKQQKIKAAIDKERLEKIEENKKEHLRQIALKSKMHSENVKRRHTTMIKQRQNNIVKILLNCARKESVRKKILRDKIFHEVEKKRQNLEFKWQQRQKLQKQQIAMEKLILQYAIQRRENAIKNYNMKISKVNQQNEDKLTKTKKNTVKKRKI